MIYSFYVKDYLSFEESTVEFSKGLNIFTGPSGAGKSIFMQAILSCFALHEVRSSICEVNMKNATLDILEYDINLNDEISLKTIKKDKVRYFLNNQSISKNSINELSHRLIKYLNSKKSDEFSSENLLAFLDRIVSKKDKKFIKEVREYKDLYSNYLKLKSEYEKILEDEKKVEDLKEFTKFEIQKIEDINPKVEEYDELSEIKSKLSKKDKVQDSLTKVNDIFNYQSSVNHLLELLNEDSSFFDDAMNELNNIIENYNDKLDDLNEIDIEHVLDRIEKLVSLTKKFGSIEEALDYKEKKKIELEKYENISFEKSILEKNINKTEIELKKLSVTISDKRKEYLFTLDERVNYYLKYLYLDNAHFTIEEKNLSINGIDDIKISLKNTDLSNISSGEFNRLKLALISGMSEYDIVENGVLFLDEIDANLSGKESESIAKLLEILSKKYQIFAISHQPQLTAIAHSHYLVEKVDNKSNIRLLNKEERVSEIARMISGKSITQDAINFATNILNIKN